MDWHQVGPRDEAVKVGRGADVCVDVGVVDTDEEIGRALVSFS